MRFPERSTPIGQKINAYLTNATELNDKTLHELFCQNRYDFQIQFQPNRWEFKDTILDHLNSGRTIVADRYAFSGVAYSSAKGIDLEWCKQGDAGLPAPDKVKKATCKL
jgi:dTMP kinase